MAKYNPEKIEKKWQQFWADQNVFNAADKSSKPKKYILVEFPYPSGEGLHMGHVRPYVAGDVVARHQRSLGNEVMFPFGWDAFGLPAENYAIKHGVQPQISTAKNIANARKQVNSWGISFDWSREVNTTDPEYYKWTQWIFLQFFKAGLAYEAVAPINWCPKDKTGLANEEVIDGRCERCGTLVEKRNMRQWYLKITAYAEQLIDGLRNLDWPAPIKLQQENWIGKSTGLLFTSPVKGTELKIQTYNSHFEAFTADTFVVIAPDHPLLPKLLEGLPDREKILKRCAEMVQRRDQSPDLEKEVEGIFTSRYTIDPVGNGELPIWVASYALSDYGTGIVKCSAHDPRDFAFAKKYNIPLKIVLVPEDPALRKKVENFEFCYSDMQNGILLEPTAFEGKKAGTVRNQIIDYCVKNKLAEPKVFYKLHDWLFSRQRYWGEPIPLIHCPKCGVVAVPEKDLPVLLPDVKKYEPTGTGDSPLAAIESWVNVECPKCSGAAKRETNTMPQWAGSSWYFLRYCDPKNDKHFAAEPKLKHWLPIDLYFGGMEHTTLHLLYSRFWNLFLHDQGLVPVKEPYARRQPHGIILAADGEKMSKSRGNVVNPDDLVKNYGADTMRMYELFLGPHDQMVSWNDQGIIGVRRFLDRAWNFAAANVDSKLKNSSPAEFEINKLIQKVSADIAEFKFNTAVAALMEFLNNAGGEEVSKKLVEQFVIVLAPFAPHLAEELWNILGHKESVAFASWPEFDPAKLQSEEVQFVVQVNGKFRANIVLPKNSGQGEVAAVAEKIQTVQNAIAGAAVKKVIFVPNRLINFVTG